MTIEIPDELAAVLAAPGHDPARAAVEAIGLEAYRQRRLSELQLRTLLGLSSHWELDAFLKQHQVEKYPAESFKYDWAVKPTLFAPKRNSTSFNFPSLPGRLVDETTTFRREDLYSDDNA